ncbi:MAG: cache domain-containing protein, partial [Candidatus Thiodiazotropha sp. (ex Lucinoma kastoroae)]|nr:cache domain-containing protein [Candidatus Thiodiazotropha sp. (ex Lucinoma kastoroae)]
MFTSLRWKILFALTGMVFLTATLILVVVQKETVNKISTLQNSKARHLVHTIELNIHNYYKSLLIYKNSILTGKKQVLTDIVQLAMIGIEHHYQDYMDGKLSETEAQQRALEDLRKMRFSKGSGYIWVNDTGRPVARMIMHPSFQTSMDNYW